MSNKQNSTNITSLYKILNSVQLDISRLPTQLAHTTLIGFTLDGTIVSFAETSIVRTGVNVTLSMGLISGASSSWGTASELLSTVQLDNHYWPLFNITIGVLAINNNINVPAYVTIDTSGNITIKLLSGNFNSSEDAINGCNGFTMSWSIYGPS